MFLTSNRLKRGFFQCAQSIRRPDEESNSFEDSGENFETTIFFKERKERKR
jgi:hypothetical protein